MVDLNCPQPLMFIPEVVKFTGYSPQHLRRLGSGFIART